MELYFIFPGLEDDGVVEAATCTNCARYSLHYATQSSSNAHDLNCTSWALLKCAHMLFLTYSQCVVMLPYKTAGGSKTNNYYSASCMVFIISTYHSARHKRADYQIWTLLTSFYRNFFNLFRNRYPKIVCLPQVGQKLWFYFLSLFINV